MANQPVRPPVTIKEWLLCHAHKYDCEGLVQACVKELGVRRGSVLKQMRRIRDDVEFKSVGDGVGDSRFATAISADEVMHDYDVPGKIHEALAELGNRVIRDSDLRTELKVSPDKWKRAANREEFADSKLEIKRGKWKGVIWGRPPVIEKIRRTIEVL